MAELGFNLPAFLVNLFFMVLPRQPSCLSLPNGGIIGVHWHAWLASLRTLAVKLSFALSEEIASQLTRMLSQPVVPVLNWR